MGEFLIYIPILFVSGIIVGLTVGKYFLRKRSRLAFYKDPEYHVSVKEHDGGCFENGITPTIRDRMDEHKTASIYLSRAVRRAYPKGKRLECQLNGKHINVKVTAHQQKWWDYPDEFTGVNVDTGETVTLYPSRVITRSDVS